MDLSDAALRKRIAKILTDGFCIRCSKTFQSHLYDESPHNYDRDEIQPLIEFAIALRDAARAEQREADAKIVRAIGHTSDLCVEHTDMACGLCRAVAAIRSQR